MGALVEFGLWNAVASAALALVAAALARLVRRPALAHTLWVLVLLKLVTPPLVTLTLPWADADGASPPAAEEPAPAAPPEVDFAPAEIDDDALPAADLPESGPTPPAAPLPWRWWAALAWLTGSALWAGWVAYHVARFRRVLRRARLAPGPLQEEAEELAQRLGLRRCPDVWLVPGAVSPMVWALGRRPCLLFPAGLLERLDGEGRAPLLAHELAHLRRRDHWLRLLELAATGLYWWNPVLWWARRELHEAEEQCCDAWAVWAVGGDGRAYALALLQAVAFVSQARLPLPAGASGGVGQVSHLKRRLAMVMQGKTSRSLSWAGMVVVFGLGLLLPLFPAVGQQPAGEPPAIVRPPIRETVGDDRDDEIEALKLKLKKLEAARAQGALGEAVAQAEASKALQAQLKDLEKMIHAKKTELQDLEAKAGALRAKLKELEAGTERNRTGQLTRPPSPMPPPRTEAGRVEDLEKKLDQIQKELEQLRRELRPKPGVRPPGPSGPRPGATPDSLDRNSRPGAPPGSGPGSI
jgi:beta-lactamase regulating signal transducer with metallopeptidase domain